MERSQSLNIRAFSAIWVFPMMPYRFPYAMPDAVVRMCHDQRSFIGTWTHGMSWKMKSYLPHVSWFTEFTDSEFVSVDINEIASLTFNVRLTEHKHTHTNKQAGGEKNTCIDLRGVFAEGFEEMTGKTARGCKHTHAQSSDLETRHQVRIWECDKSHSPNHHTHTHSHTVSCLMNNQIMHYYCEEVHKLVCWKHDPKC